MRLYDETLVIKTCSGYRYIERVDWTIRGAYGRFGLHKPDIF